MNLKSVINSFKNAKIIIFGDVMLDIYQYGEVKRVSPEAPVPVLNYKKEEERLGGAANVALNLKSLGFTPILVGKIGNDNKGDKILNILEQEDISSEFILRSDKTRTICKTRYIANNQQLLRVDVESSDEISSKEIEYSKKILSNKKDCRAFIFSDYGKGIITKNSFTQMNQLAKEKSIWTLVDPKKKNYHLYKDIDVMTPNHHEAAEDASMPCNSEKEIKVAGKSLIEKHQLKQLLITRGSKGIALINPAASPLFIPTYARQVFDVCGAGDTVIATFTGALVAGGSFEVAAKLANHAAGIVVSKFGTSTVSP